MMNPIDIRNIRKYCLALLNHHTKLFIFILNCFVVYGVSSILPRWDHLIIINALFYLNLYKWMNACNKTENYFNLITAKPIIGFFAKYCANFIVFFLISFIIFFFSAVDSNTILMNSFIFTNVASFLLYYALELSYLNVGDRNLNITLAFSFVACIIPFVNVCPYNLIENIWLLSFILAFVPIVLLLKAEYRAIYYPEGGIGIFFGSFNPVHNTHISLIKKAINDRKLSLVLIQINTVPKLHKLALKNKEIKITKYKNGLRVYEKTPNAIKNKDYFPTGNKFFDYNVRQKLLLLALEDTNLLEKVTVLNMQRVYDVSGYPGVIKKIRLLYPSYPIHGIHGSDVGGIWVRYLFNRFSFIYPYPVIRRDNISSTLIRTGKKGLTTKSVQNFLNSII